MNIDKLKNNRFFDKISDIRVNFDIWYMIDQLCECLKSQNININKYNSLTLLDVYIRSITGDIRTNTISEKTDTKVLTPLYIMLGNKINEYGNNVNDVQLENVKNNILHINDLAFIKFKPDVLDSIINNISIINKEYNIFIKELFDYIKDIYYSINLVQNIPYIMSITHVDSMYFSIKYSGDPKDIKQDCFIIYSQMISFPGQTQEGIIFMEKSFYETEEFKNFLNNISKN